MIKNLKWLIASVALPIPLMALSQSMGYMDADNPNQAIGMMRATIYSSQIMLDECSSRFPDQNREMKTNLDAWKKTEAVLLNKTEYYWMVATKGHATEAAAMERSWRISVKGQFEVIEKTSMDPNIVRKVMSEHCQQYFGDLASGVWRKRTPKEYSFLDHGPDVPANGSGKKRSPADSRSKTSSHR